jgi:hypothetical protein
MRGAEQLRLSGEERLGNTLEEGETRGKDSGWKLKRDRRSPLRENRKVEEMANDKAGASNPYGCYLDRIKTLNG